jgi:hypothetical protein
VSNKGGIGIELLSDPGNKLVLPEPSDGFPIASAAIAVAALIAGVAWTYFAMKEGPAKRQPSLEIGARVVSFALEDMKADLAAESRLMADDARIRTTLATPEMDRATVEDVLQDVLRAAGLSAIAVFGPQGKATAAVGPKELGEIDLSVTKLTPGEGRLWSLTGELMVVASARVKLGSDVHTILCARKVEPKFLQRLADAVDNSVAIGMEGKILVSALIDPIDRDTLSDAMKRGSVGPATIGTRDVLVKELESSRRPMMVATAAAARGSKSQRLVWLPMVILLVSGVASVVVANRR